MCARGEQLASLFRCSFQYFSIDRPTIHRPIDQRFKVNYGDSFDHVHAGSRSCRSFSSLPAKKNRTFSSDVKPSSSSGNHGVAVRRRDIGVHLPRLHLPPRSFHRQTPNDVRDQAFQNSSLRKSHHRVHGFRRQQNDPPRRHRIICSVVPSIVDGAHG